MTTATATVDCATDGPAGSLRSDLKLERMGSSKVLNRNIGAADGYVEMGEDDGGDTSCIPAWVRHVPIIGLLIKIGTRISVFMTR